MLHVEDPTLHDHRAHVHGQILHGHGVPPERLSVEGLALGLRFLLPLFLGSSGSGHFANGLLPEGLHGVNESLAFQLVAGFNGNRHRRGKPLPEILLHRRDMLHQRRLAVGSQTDGQALP